MDHSHSYHFNKEKYQGDANLLLQEFNDRDQLAFRFIFESFYRSSVLFAEGILNNQQFEVEDIVQDAFIKLWNQTEAFVNVTSIKSFIYTTIKNACLDKLRRRQVAESYEGHAARHQKLMEAEFIEPLINSETIRLINAAIEALPEQGRNIFKMSLAGLKNDDIAEKLKISVNTVKTHKQRALASLRLTLGDATTILVLLYHDHLLK